MKNIRLSLIILLFVGSSCSKSANDPTEAMNWLLGCLEWDIAEIKANDKTIMKDGVAIPVFSGLEFNRYMKTIRFAKDGFVDGKYNIGDTKTALKWRINLENIEIFDSNQPENSGTWLILPENVTKNSLVMHITSTSFDFPRQTTIKISYKCAN